MAKSNRIITTALLIISIALGVLLYVSNHTKEDFKNQVSLLTASLDSTKISYNKDKGVWESSKLQYQASEEELKAFLKERDKQLYELAKQKQVREVIVTEGRLKVDTVVPTVVEVAPTTKEEIRHIAVKDEFIDLKVVSRPTFSDVKLTANTDLTLTAKKDGTIVATPNSPYIFVNDIKGFNKVPEQKKHNWKYIVGGIVAGSIVYGITR